MELIDKIKGKVTEINNEIHRKVVFAADWASREENKEKLAAIGTAVVVVGGYAINGIDKARKRAEDEREKCEIYDPRTGTWWETRKRLTNSQKMELERRYRNGQSKGEALQDMKMLKY